MKTFSTLFLVFALVSFQTIAQTTVQVNCSEKAQSSNTVKRGYLYNNEDYRNAHLDKIADDAAAGAKIVMLHRKINLDKTGTGEDEFGNLGNEIYGDTVNGFQYRLDGNYVDFMAKVRELGLEVLAQINGTPPDFPRDPNYKRVPEEIRVVIKGIEGSKGEIDKDFEIPPPSQWEAFATVMSQWMAAMEDSVAKVATTNKDVQIIWCGSEEVTHTIGWPVLPETGEIDSLWIKGESTAQMRAEAKKINIERYADMWSILSKKLDSLGIQDGCVQNNASSLDHYIDLRNQLLLEKNLPPTDFITIQNYKGHSGDITKQIIDNLVADIQALRSADAKYDNTKILFDRYAFTKGVGEDANETVCGYLESEAHMMKNIDYMYGYCTNAGRDLNVSQIMSWLNFAPETSRPISGLPAEFNGLQKPSL
ncbi:MAG: hypothetical protein MI892_11520, partial [Desulfobacterales bacterium]|nr:hypothetical protein [Desulfobacterales bacterium]